MQSGPIILKMTHNVRTMHSRYWETFRALSRQCAKEIFGYDGWALDLETLAQWLRDNGVEAQYTSVKNNTYFKFDVDDPGITMLLLRG